MSWATARLHLRNKAGVKVAEATTGADARIVIDGPGGRIDLTVPAAATTGIDVGSYRFALELTYIDGTVTTLETNTLNILEDIARD